MVPVMKVLTYVAAPTFGAIIIAPKTIQAPMSPPEKAHIGILLSSNKFGIGGLRKKRIIEKITTPPKKLIKAACDG